MPTQDTSGAVDLEQQFTEIVEQYSDLAYSVAFRMLRNAEDAEDAVQEAYISAFKALPNFKGQSKLSTWLYRIASNRVIDHVRRRRMILVPLDSPAGESHGAPREVAAGGRNPQETLLDRESARGVAQAIGDLPAEYRELIILRHFQHRSYEEIAKIKRSPLGTVKNRLFRAREALRRRIAR